MYYMVGNNTFPENMTDGDQCWDGWTIQNLMLDDSLEVKLASCEVAVPAGLFVKKTSNSQSQQILCGWLFTCGYSLGGIVLHIFTYENVKPAGFDLERIEKIEKKEKKTNSDTIGGNILYTITQKVTNILLLFQKLKQRTISHMVSTKHTPQQRFDWENW